MSADPADLSNLHDIVLPAAIYYWPPAPGWWILALAVLALAAILIIRLLAHYRRNAYRRVALRELDAIGPAVDSASAVRISGVLKRTALVAFPREQVAGLTGPAWLAFLDRTGRTEAFGRGDLATLAYGGSTLEGSAVSRAAKHWVRRHRGGGC